VPRRRPPPPGPYRVGQLVSLDLADWHSPDVELEVLEVLDDGRLLLRFPSGGTLYVSSSSSSLSSYRKATP
jgi:hypothetical protein